mgnify:CR=1 FL=1
MLNNFVSLFTPGFAETLVYMLQACEYNIPAYLKWIWRVKDFRKVSHRGQLKRTRYAKILLIFVRVGIALQILVGIIFMYLGVRSIIPAGFFIGFAIIAAYPFLWGHLVIVPLVAGRLLISDRKATNKIKSAEHVFKNHKAIKIAVLGSYGKTTMKELLKEILASDFKVAATPANKNVAISHANFAHKLEGKEDILIIEYGEGAPGDIAKFAKNTHPDYAVITGLAPAHLDKYPDMHAAAQDIFSISQYIDPSKIYVNSDSLLCRDHITKDMPVFNSKTAIGWQIQKVNTEVTGSSFSLSKDKKEFKFETKMIGEHQVAFVAFAAALAIDLGADPKKLAEAVKVTKPFEHRMQPYQLNGAWIIDDTYNGNIEGIRAGTKLLKQLTAKRKIYVSPGLVDQGIENEAVHIEMGKLIAEASPEQVVLMKNSVTEYIKQGLKNHNFQGKIIVQPDPLDFYNHLGQFVAAGDLVVMQNDWPDNYA